VALVVASLLPGLFGAGWIYMAGAAAGGAYFVYRAAQLARAPSRAKAMASFFASLVQLSLLLAAATVDALLR
jgi:protoheme IX farnesyltransferase